MGQELQSGGAGTTGERPLGRTPGSIERCGEPNPVELLRRRVERICLRADRILEELEARFGALPPAAGEPEIETEPRRAPAAAQVLRFSAGRPVRASPCWRR